MSGNNYRYESVCQTCNKSFPSTIPNCQRCKSCRTNATTKTCAVDSCNLTARYGHKYCNAHDIRNRTYGNPLIKKDRFTGELVIDPTLGSYYSKPEYNFTPIYYKNCPDCDQLFVTSNTSRIYCSSHSGHHNYYEPKFIAGKWYELVCECGNLIPFFAGQQGMPPRRCNQCKKLARQKEKFNYESRKRTNGPYENIDPQKVFARDNYICQRCFEPILMNETAPHPQSPSVDHIIPLAKGGTHTWDNIQSMHFWCNSVKSDSVDNQDGDN
jgi:hypothetical protein